MSGLPGSAAFSPLVRPAVVADVAEILRLASLMYESMGVTADPAWRMAAADALERRIGQDAVVFVADSPDGTGSLAASGAGTIATRLPGPLNPTARVGYIQWVCTDPRWQRRGLARSVTAALLGWFGELGVGSVELHATPQAEGLYRSLGFGQGLNPGLRIRL